MSNPHICAQRLVVEFPIYDGANQSLKKTLVRASTGGRFARDASRHVIVRAIDGVDLEIHEGERVGLLGHNGSGKTTLLRALSGVYAPVSGRLDVRGRVAAILDSAMGLDGEASGYENIYLRGLLAGFKPAEIRARQSAIAEFTGLGDYLRLPVRTYSSGMALRLAFSISASIRAEILLLDEWLSVGDASFRERAAERMRELVDNAAILVMASHDNKLIERVCNRVIRMDRGRIIEDRRLNPPPAQAAVQAGRR